MRHEAIQDRPHATNKARIRRQPSYPNRRKAVVAANQGPAWSVLHRDTVPPGPRRVGLPRGFTVHGGRHETARVPCPSLTLEFSSQAIMSLVLRLAGPRQPSRARGCCLPIWRSSSICCSRRASCARSVTATGRRSVSMRVKRVSFQFVCKMRFDEFPQVGIGRETRPAFLAARHRFGVEGRLVHRPIAPS